MTRHLTALALVLSMIGVSAPLGSAHALSMQECSAKYKAAKAAGTKGLKWNDFRKTECGSDAAAPSTAAPAPTTAPAAKTTAAPRPEKKEAARAAPSPATTPSGNAVFPTAVSPKYSTESAGKARMHTCLDQYNANKADNGNGGLKWIEKGGGYYSQCNKRLKG
jgi:hypothetical protein